MRGTDVTFGWAQSILPLKTTNRIGRIGLERYTTPYGTQSALIARIIRMSRHTPAGFSLNDVIGSNEAGWNAGIERRRSPRAILHWTLYLSCNGAKHPLRTESRDISRDGFYCLVDQPIRPGERIKCDIVVPTHSLEDPDNVVYLRCDALTVRVEKIGENTQFGLACRIEDYHLIQNPRANLRLQDTGTGQ